MIYLLGRNHFFHLVNNSEIHPVLSEIAKFISLSILWFTAVNITIHCIACNRIVNICKLLFVDRPVASDLDRGSTCVSYV